MADPEGTIRKPVNAGLIARAAMGMRSVVDGVKYVVTGVSPANWFGPNQPIAPIAPQTQEAGAEGRQFDYLTGINLQQLPRAQENISFQQLRDLADGWDVLRLIIETRKDQMEGLNWTIKPIEKGSTPDKRCEMLLKLFKSPDGEHSWSQWMRMVLEDLLVIDAVSIYPLRTVGGDILSLMPMDGSMFKRVLDVYGRTPQPPSPAYQQVIKGLPAVNYTSAQLIYLPRNVRNNRIYGYSPVEQIIMTVNMALRRQLTQLSYYTHGSTPDLIMSVPKEWNADQIKKYKLYWDSMLAGNIGNKAGTQFVIDGMKPIDTKERMLKDDFDEWLVRVACFAFSIQPTPFIKQMNRGEQKSQKEQSQTEGLEPQKNWFRELMNKIIQSDKYFGYADLEFSWQEEEAQDPETQANINALKVKAGRMTIDEWRALDGDEPLPDGMGAVPMIYTGTGATLLETVINGDPEPTTPNPEAAPGKEPAELQTPEKQVAKAQKKKY